MNTRHAEPLKIDIQPDNLLRWEQVAQLKIEEVDGADQLQKEDIPPIGGILSKRKRSDTGWNDDEYESHVSHRLRLSEEALKAADGAAKAAAEKSDEAAKAAAEKSHAAAKDAAEKSHAVAKAATERSYAEAKAATERSYAEAKAANERFDEANKAAAQTLAAVTKAAAEELAAVVKAAADAAAKAAADKFDVVYSGFAAQMARSDRELLLSQQAKDKQYYHGIQVNTNSTNQFQNFMLQMRGNVGYEGTAVAASQSYGVPGTYPPGLQYFEPQAHGSTSGTWRSPSTPVPRTSAARRRFWAITLFFECTSCLQYIHQQRLGVLCALWCTWDPDINVHEIVPSIFRPCGSRRLMIV